MRHVGLFAAFVYIATAVNGDYVAEKPIEFADAISYFEKAEENVRRLTNSLLEDACPGDIPDFAESCPCADDGNEGRCVVRSGWQNAKVNVNKMAVNYKAGADEASKKRTKCLATKVEEIYKEIAKKYYDDVTREARMSVFQASEEASILWPQECAAGNSVRKPPTWSVSKDVVIVLPKSAAHKDAIQRTLQKALSLLTEDDAVGIVLYGQAESDISVRKMRAWSQGVKTNFLEWLMPELGRDATFSITAGVNKAYAMIEEFRLGASGNCHATVLLLPVDAALDTSDWKRDQLAKLVPQDAPPVVFVSADAIGSGTDDMIDLNRGFMSVPRWNSRVENGDAVFSVCVPVYTDRVVGGGCVDINVLTAVTGSLDAKANYQTALGKRCLAKRIGTQQDHVTPATIFGGVLISCLGVLFLSAVCRWISQKAPSPANPSRPSRPGPRQREAPSTRRRQPRNQELTSFRSNSSSRS